MGNQPDYLKELLGDQIKYRSEYSVNNHFMYWNYLKKKQNNVRRGRKNGRYHHVPEGWEEPTRHIHMKYKEWLSHANTTDSSKLTPDEEHWYFRLIGCGKMGKCDRESAEFLFDELSFFQPRHENNLYMVDPTQQKGIHCRFGMKGVIAENHFDGSRNMIALLGGERRYILAHPDQCQFLELYPKGHPSSRHSAVDWSNPDLEKYTHFKHAQGNEVVMQAGDVLYLPTNWFHHIISLDINYQCNTRSGISYEYMSSMHSCGF